MLRACNLDASKRPISTTRLSKGYKCIMRIIGMTIGKKIHRRGETREHGSVSLSARGDKQES